MGSSLGITRNIGSPLRWPIPGAYCIRGCCEARISSPEDEWFPLMGALEGQLPSANGDPLPQYTDYNYSDR